MQFDESKLFEKDYLNLRETEPIKEIIKKYASDGLEDPVNLRCFSDSIFRYLKLYNFFNKLKR